MEYLHVLSRPKVIDQEHDTVWTEAYIDSTVSGPSVSTPPVRLCALLNMFLKRSLKSIELHLQTGRVKTASLLCSSERRAD